MDTPTIEFCRAQAATHLARAKASNLPNVRAVALTAAKTWMREAESAERILERRKRNASANVG
jgi:hypothetical protein